MFATNAGVYLFPMREYIARQKLETMIFMRTSVRVAERKRRRFRNDEDDLQEVKMVGFINYFLFCLLVCISAIVIRIYFDDRDE